MIDGSRVYGHNYNDPAKRRFRLFPETYVLDIIETGCAIRSWDAQIT